MQRDGVARILHTEMLLVQVAEFLQAAHHKYSTRFCGVLVTHDPAAPAAYALLCAAPRHLHNIVLKHHPLLDQHMPLCALLEQLPACLRPFALEKATRSKVPEGECDEPVKS